MLSNKVVSRETWLDSRKALLEKEKEFTRLRDELSQSRRDMPWVKIEKDYQFESNRGQVSLSDLFNGRSQLLTYHFMFGVDWEEGCPSCSFWADGYNGTDIHLNHRDISFTAVSSASLDKLNAYKARMGWTFNWVSSFGSDFNKDFNVSFSEDMDAPMYNYRRVDSPGEELPGLSVFYKNEAGEIFHTYSTYARGMDMLNATYHHMDLMPKGRDEEGLPWSMAWLRRHDQYGS